MIGDTNLKFSTYDLHHNAANFPGLDWANNNVMDKFDKDGICYWRITTTGLFAHGSTEVTPNGQKRVADPDRVQAIV